MYRPVVNKSARYLRATEACSDTNWSRNTLMKVAIKGWENLMKFEEL